MRFWILQPVKVLPVIIILALLCSGCSETQEEGSQVPQGEGFTDITPRDNPDRISIGDALFALESTNLAGRSDTSPLHIYYIRGESVDSNGTARGWIIGVLKDQKPYYFVYTGNGQQIMDCNSDLPSQEINPETILAPDALFRQRPLLIQDLTDGDKREIESLEVRDGSYIMTCRSDGTIRVYYFNAVSGIETKQE